MKLGNVIYAIIFIIKEEVGIVIFVILMFVCFVIGKNLNFNKNLYIKKFENYNIMFLHKKIFFNNSNKFN
jgi:hypothetical protein